MIQSIGAILTVALFGLFVVVMAVLASIAKRWIFAGIWFGLAVVAGLAMSILFNWWFILWTILLAGITYLFVDSIPDKGIKAIWKVLCGLFALGLLIGMIFFMAAPVKEKIYGMMSKFIPNIIDNGTPVINPGEKPEILIEDEEEPKDLIVIQSAEEPNITGYILNGCPTASLGTNPNTGEPLIFKDHPYPGVLCEYELYFESQPATIKFTAGTASLVQDWALTCPTGPACEGTWVATDTFTVPGGWLVHMWVYSSGYVAAARFPSFACEYLAYGDKGHTNANIRVPDWAGESGSILSIPACAGFSGEPGLLP